MTEKTPPHALPTSTDYNWREIDPGWFTCEPGPFSRLTVYEHNGVPRLRIEIKTHSRDENTHEWTQARNEALPYRNTNEVSPESEGHEFTSCEVGEMQWWQWLRELGARSIDL